MSKRKSDGGQSSHEGSLPKAKKIPFWKDGLKVAMEDPTLVVKRDESIVIIRDKYPKAKYHFLIIPKNSIPDMQTLTGNHVQLLKHMEKEAFSIINSHCRGMTSDQFNFGFHAIPSMRPLHMHVISQDFDSPCLKTKKHWNSFTTDFFRKYSDILNELESKGKIEIKREQYETLLKSDLRCHWCEGTQKNIPALKLHIKSCSRNKCKKVLEENE